MSTSTIEKKQPRKLTPKGEERKKLLLEKALKLFGEKGYHATTMNDIARAAGTGKGTVYWYWDSKEGIFLELLNQKFGHYMNALEAPLKMNLTAPEKMLVIIAEIGNIFSRYRSFCKLVFLLIADDSERFNTDVINTTRNYYQKFRRIIREVLEEGQKEGTISKNIDPEYMATLMISILDGVLAQEGVLGTTFSITKIGETLLTVLKGGLFIKDSNQL